MLAAALLLALSASEPKPFLLANGAGETLEQLEIRPAERPGEWKALAPGRLSPGARGAVPAVGGIECAYDIRAQVAGKTLVWPAVNLCDVRVVFLNRRPGGQPWTDYE